MHESECGHCNIDLDLWPLTFKALLRAAHQDQYPVYSLPLNLMRYFCDSSSDQKEKFRVSATNTLCRKEIYINLQNKNVSQFKAKRMKSLFFFLWPKISRCNVPGRCSFWILREIWKCFCSTCSIFNCFEWRLGQYYICIFNVSSIFDVHVELPEIFFPKWGNDVHICYIFASNGQMKQNPL